MRGIKVEVRLTHREAEAVLRCHGFTNGHGVARSAALQSAQVKLIGALSHAVSRSDES